VSGKLLMQARKDAIKFATAGGFEEDIILTTPNGLFELSFKSLTTGHTERFDTEGNAVNSQSFHVNIPEQVLIDGNYPYTNSEGKIKLINHQVQFIDNAGANTVWVIAEQMPNKTTGLIPCILGKSE
jgi:hypothetical protein